MKKIIYITSILIVSLFISSCPDFLGTEPAGRWNPVDPDYDATTDPDAVTDPEGKPLVSIESSADPGTTVASVTWSWSADIALCTFRYYVGQDDTFTFTDEPYGNIISHHLTGVSGTYYIFVQAKSVEGIESDVESASAELYIDDTTPPDVNIRLIAPAAGYYTGAVGTSHINFKWTVDDDSDVDQYHVRVGNAEDLETATISQTFDSDTTTCPVQVGLIGGPYYGFWQAGAADAAGNVTWSASRRIRFGYVPNDIDGDGDSDILAGAPYYNTNYGRLRLYEADGSSIPGSVALWSGSDAWQSLGQCLNFIGDFDGDGKGDFAVGDPYPGQTRVYCSTKTNFPQSDEETVYNAGINFGSAVAGGDFNGDGYDDLAVGARSASSNDRGRIFLYPGNAGGSLPSEYASGYADADFENLGASLVMADINNDGYDDIIAGAPGQNNSGVYGKVYIYFGGSGTPDLTPDLTLTASRTNYFGFEVAAGDINGDGYADIVVGAPGDNENGTDTGAVYIYKGGEAGSINTAPEEILVSQYTGADDMKAGYSVDCGDITGDGLADVLVGSPGYGGAGNNGAVWFYQGVAGSSISWSSYDVLIPGEAANVHAGQCVSVAGDINKDGKNDIMYCIPGDSNVLSNSGRVGIIWGALTPSTNYDQHFDGTDAGEQLGGRAVENIFNFGRTLGRM